jgi:hypothetical protein
LHRKKQRKKETMAKTIACTKAARYEDEQQFLSFFKASSHFPLHFGGSVRSTPGLNTRKRSAPATAQTRHFLMWESWSILSFVRFLKKLKIGSID